MSWYLLVIGLLLLAGCVTERCKAPYMEHGNGCCRDGNSNGICDVDDVKIPETQKYVIEEPTTVTYEVGQEEVVCNVCNIQERKIKNNALVDELAEKYYDEQREEAALKKNMIRYEDDNTKVEGYSEELDGKWLD